MEKPEDYVKTGDKKIMGEKVRVQKIIAESGYCSRRKAEKLIEEGKVFVNGLPITIGDQAVPKKDEIRIGKDVIEMEDKVYLMLNKPKGYITTNSDLFSRKKVIDLIDIPERVFPVGRLDRDATGLLLLTNDGDWANKIMHPRYELEKEYFAELDKPIERKIIAEMNKGFRLSDGYVKPIVKMISKNYCSISLHEGRNKIVKRIFNEFGFRVIQLKRTRVGEYRLGNLKNGHFVEVNPKLIGKAKPKKKEVKRDEVSKDVFRKSLAKKKEDRIKRNEKRAETRKANRKTSRNSKDVFNPDKYGLQKNSDGGYDKVSRAKFKKPTNSKNIKNGNKRD